MHLKKLIISGFKSFADKVVLNFDDGITGIVGPNGSGKSNLIDAVRWVMGEQNAKQLRGKIATDIIFAGSDKRKALGMAEVTLIFDNSDFSSFCPPEYRHETEIALTRRLYIDGQREYLINQKQCRLKDIVEFFATTGLGGRSYSMIQQGQVERILNARPEEVREILEEAAGTSVFKIKKASAEKKLEITKSHLSRLEDIVSELQGRLETLKDQAEKALEYRKISSELKERDLRLLAHSYADNFEKKQAILESMDTEYVREAEFIGELSALEAKHVELTGRLDESNPELNQINEEITKIRVLIARAESTLQNQDSLVESAKRRIEEIEKEIELDQKNLETLDAEVDEAVRALSLADQQALELRDIVESMRIEVDSAAEARQVFQSRLDDLEEEMKNYDRMLESNAIRCESMERDRVRYLKDQAQCEQRMRSIEEDLVSIESELQEIQKSAEAHRSGLEQLLVEKQSRQEAIIKRQEEIKSLSEERDRLKEVYIGTKARYVSLKEIEKDVGNIGSILQKLKETGTSSETMIKGLFTDYISLNKKSSEISRGALSAFEMWTERFVIEDLNQVNKLASFVHKHGFSSVPVIIPSKCRGNDEEEVRIWAEGVDAQCWTELLSVSSDGRFLDPVIKRMYYLPAVHLSDEDISVVPDGIILFTANGVIVNDRSDFIIGSTEKGGILSRKSEIELLSKNLKTDERDLAKCQNELDNLDKLQIEDRLVIRDIEEKLGRQNLDVMDITKKLQTVLVQRDNKKSLLDDAAKQYEKLEEDVFRCREELKALGEVRISYGKEKDALVLDMDSLGEEMSSVEEKHEEIGRLFRSREVELGKAEAKASALRGSHLTSQNQLERLQASVARRFDEKNRKEEEIRIARNNQVKAREEIESLFQQMDDLEKKHAIHREASAGLLQEIREIEARLRKANDRKLEIENLKTKSNYDLEKAENALQAVVSQAEERYQINIADHKFKRESFFDSKYESKEIHRLRIRIENMGNINMMAVEEYEKISERYNFIKGQREEINGSIALLEDAISEISETARNKFCSVFNLINQNFEKRFPVLFPGGEAHLQLTNDTDPLNGGVDIMVRLPGKKTQHMNLFSGGEKALTAISLIFALLETKPTPFCFLDEVDAPLDEANVGRYNRVLDVLSERFQFIIITHNRRTMEVLDQLYGVTMQEAGVSKVIGVDMKKELPDHLKKAFKDEQAKRSLQGATSVN
ncbi:MAG: chromosome segregation protein SMC [Oligoflexales bacterium]|nr:chromosome segregation protein SMC [Oligoflexales bacterium]